MSNKLIISVFKKYLKQKKKNSIFNKKQLELGRVVFVLDEFKYGNFVLKSSFRMEMVNQQGTPNSIANPTLNTNKTLIKYKYIILYIFMLFIVTKTFMSFNPTSNNVIENLIIDYTIDMLDDIKIDNQIFKYFFKNFNIFKL